ncbi:MAG: SRPBCC family protein [Solirubrobacteraceae bacterium]|nr:SRPBCC family protein [Solirubrobacteraceae bacterium]
MTALTGSLITLDGRDALRFERQLPHPVERVWRAVSEPAELGQWFVGPVEWGPTEGETSEVMGQTMAVTEVRPPHALAWSWGDEHYRFDLTAEGDGTRLVFTHVFVTTYGPGVQHAAGWETYLDRLAALLTGSPLGEEAAHDPIAEYHEAYVAKFGADPTPGRKMIASMRFRDLQLDGDVVRLQRRYRHPVTRMWRAFTDPAELALWFPETQEYEIAEAQEPHLIAARWWGEALRIELQDSGGETILTFQHTIGEPPAAGWDRCFFALEALLAGQPMSREVSLEHWPTVHERYAERFGVDPELGRAAHAASVEATD